MTDLRARLTALLAYFERERTACRLEAARYAYGDAATLLAALLRSPPEADEQWPGQLEHEIAGALKSCIDAHGPITKQWVGSAAKRVIKSCGAALLREPPKPEPKMVCPYDEQQCEFRNAKGESCVVNRRGNPAFNPRCYRNWLAAVSEEL